MRTRRMLRVCLLVGMVCLTSLAVNSQVSFATDFWCKMCADNCVRQYVMCCSSPVPISPGQNDFVCPACDTKLDACLDICSLTCYPTQ